MLWTRYLPTPPAAMPIMMLVAMGVLLLLSACQPKTPTETANRHAVKGAESVSRMAVAPESVAEIKYLMQQARDGGDIEHVFQELERLMLDPSPVVHQEAAFRRAQLMLAGNRPDAARVMQATMDAYPDHALVPYAYVWKARWWMQQDDANATLASLRKALVHPRLTRELVDEVFDIGPAIVQYADEGEAISWLLSAAQIDVSGRDSWLRMAARRASLDTIDMLMTNGSLSPDILPAFSLYAGRAHLMSGDMVGVNKIASSLSKLMPGSAESRQLQSWAAGEISAATIGVLLPLSGKYARFGEQALRGVRMALAATEFDQYITLRVEDTGSNAETAIKAYRKLANESVNIIVGPLLAETTEAIAPYLKYGIPVISLTGRTHLAHKSDALFVHTLSPLAQIDVMANYAWKHDAKRMVVIAADGESQKEADMFVASFESLGGEVIETLKMERGTLDYRDVLNQLRFETDDDQLLAELDEELNVFLPEMEMEFRVPVNFDAIYLALNGKQIALLAGQLAYADISGVPLYGSSRWQDGHLLDDRGRYLSRARFAISNLSQEMDHKDPAIRQFNQVHRSVWGDENTSQLMSLAYDTMRIATMITSRLGLEKQALFRELRDPDGFPAMTGHVLFDASGVGQKQLDIFSIKKGKIVPAR
ncbi:penicillin-binding protein activator [Mariprofundus sp. EBB-1]|uniref:penicillin-binding protein activator n=1 Tax=Mariprofundus sp. EBB-1 TaxID=2650971 RepID=UPI000EF187B5|nr:penicillin-binding protein activator [Mariprofundus sp. EBB-1]RLL52707.1 penicillin-binding protein activator [Mariprofundus sp. EBB-1]